MMQDKFLSTQQLLQQCSIRISSRAKYMRLSVSLEKGIVVVVPKTMSRRQFEKLIPEFVKDKQYWINDAIEKLQAQKRSRPSIEHCSLPEAVSLPALEQVFSITYDYLPGSSLKLLHQNSYQLRITGDLNSKKEVFALLEHFFKDYARYFLQQRLDQLSQKSGLTYNRLTIRAQKTRWGSCSAKKNINLNYRLLFIKKSLLDYILLHELVHTVHMNHSKAFWSSLASLIPDARSRDKQVNQISASLPCWIFYK